MRYRGEAGPMVSVCTPDSPSRQSWPAATESPIVVRLPWLHARTRSDHVHLLSNGDSRIQPPKALYAVGGPDERFNPSPDDGTRQCYHRCAPLP